jgi:hypothetical protein
VNEGIELSTQGGKHIGSIGEFLIFKSGDFVYELLRGRQEPDVLRITLFLHDASIFRLTLCFQQNIITIKQRPPVPITLWGDGQGPEISHGHEGRTVLKGEAAMGIILDLLKEIPLSAVLRERLSAQETDFGTKLSVLTDENTVLKKKNTALKKENAVLKRQLQKLRAIIQQCKKAPKNQPTKAETDFDVFGH